LRSLKGFELLGANQNGFIITLLTGAAIALLGLASIAALGGAAAVMRARSSSGYGELGYLGCNGRHG
jgi:hypothetical protein